MKKNKNGFSLVELLAVIVILGILSTISLVAYNKYIDNAKKEKDKQNEITIVTAAKSYLESNPEKRPKSIGESLKIHLDTLKEANYLKEDITNSKDESCMPNSYVYVYKNNYDKYTYKGVLYCGDDKVDPDKNVEEPIISDFKFSNKEDVKNASFSMVIHGNKEDTVGIESYNYSITVYNASNTEVAEVYNSGSIPGNDQNIIVVNNNLISDYIKVTEYSQIKVTVVVRNSLGGMYELTKTTEYEDSEKPICGSVKNEPQEDEWYNKKDILQDNKVRQLTVECSDGNGSGCIRSTFSKTWPEVDKKSVESSVITIKDNKGLETDCNVRVNVDIYAPTIKVTAYNNKNEEVTSKTAIDGNTETIEKNSYKGNYNGWLNSTNYSGGVKYKVELSDDIRLSKYTWETGGSDSESGYILDGDKKTNSKELNIYLKDEGNRTGTLTVYDAAGNTTTIIIYADIDYTNPTCSNEVSCTGGGDCSRWLGIGKSLTIKTLCEDKGSSNCALNTGGSFTYNDNINTTKGGAGGDKTPVDVYDNAGNKGTCPANITVKIDHISPTCNNKVTCTDGGDCSRWLGIGKLLIIKTRCSDKGGSNCVLNTGGSFTYNDNINTTKGGAGGDKTPVDVYDNAGNKGTCPANVTVRIDVEPPTVPTISAFKWKANASESRPSSSKGLDNYTAGNWSNKRIFTMASGSTDNLSKVDHYEYKTTGATTNEDDVKSSTRNIEADGTSTISYRACDVAKNCSDYSSSMTIKVDTIYPIVSCDMANNIISNVKVIDGKNNSSGVKIDCEKEDSSCSGVEDGSARYAVTTSSSKPYASATDVWESSIPNVQPACGNKYYGYVKGEDRAGNVAITKCGEYSADNCCSESNPFGCNWTTVCRSGITFLYAIKNNTLFGVGYARHGQGTEDKIYLIKDSNGRYPRKYVPGQINLWQLVCIESFLKRGYTKMAEEVTKDGNTCYKVWITSSCLSTYVNEENLNHICPYSTCPG